MKKKLGLIAVMLFTVIFATACGEESPWKIHRDIEDWKNEKYLELPSHISMLDKYVAMVIPSEDEVEGYISILIEIVKDKCVSRGENEN